MHLNLCFRHFKLEFVFGRSLKPSGCGDISSVFLFVFLRKTLTFENLKVVVLTEVNYSLVNMAPILAVILVIMSQSDTQRRYFIDDDNDLNGSVAFPIDMCIQSKAYHVTEHVYYECSPDGTSVNKYKFNGSGCSDRSQATITVFDSDDKSPCGTNKFSCSGVDQYQITGYYIGQASCTSPLPWAELPIAIGCYCDSNTTSYSLS